MAIFNLSKPCSLQGSEISFEMLSSTRGWCLVVLISFVSLTSFVQAETKVRVETVTRSIFQDQTEALGTLRANESVALTANVTENISAIHFDDGETVEAGQILVEMTSAEESALLKEAESNVLEAKRQLTRIQALVKNGTASESVLDQRQRDYDAAKARLRATQSRLSDRIVTAPFSGRVGLRRVSLGALVRPGDLITTITDDSQMKLDFTVPSVFLPMLVADLPIEATTRAYREQAFQGKISSIDNQIDPVTRAITVRALMPNNDGRLKQGMLMEIDLRMNPRESLTIPESALMPSGRDNYVMVAVPEDEGAIAERRKVTVASRRVGEVEVLEGVNEGELVITHGAFKIKPGSAVVWDLSANTASIVN